MKKLLSLLMCFVFLQAQTYALRGGPGQTGLPTITGAYSGILTDTTVNAAGIPGTDIGLFLLNATTNGASNGQLVIFSQTTGGVSDFFSGGLTGLSDITTGTFTGVFNGMGQQSNGSSRSVTISGQMKCIAIKAGTGGIRVQRLTGTAAAQILTIIIALNNIAAFTGAAKTYAVTGWQTSSSAAGAGFAVGGTGG